MSFHELKPLVQIGKAGITAAVVDQVKTALKKHEYVKVRFLASAIDGGKKALAEELAKKTGSEVAQLVGFTVVLRRIFK